MSRLKTGIVILYKLTENEKKDRVQMHMPENPIIGQMIPQTKTVVNNKLPCAPAIITAVFPNEYGKGIDGVNCKVMLDSNLPDLWKTSIKEGKGDGEFSII